MYYESALARINELEAKRLAILNNRDWNLEGRNRQKAAWDREKAQARIDTLTNLAVDVATLRRRFLENEARRAEAATQAAKRWDFQRMQYESTAVKATIDNLKNDFTISGMDGVGELEKMYLAVVHGQDNHKRRALCEVGADYLIAHFPGDARAKALAQTMRGDLEALLTTPELDTINKAGENLADVGLNIIDAVKVCKKYYQDGMAGVMGPDEFDALLTGITVTYSDYTGDVNRWKVTLTIETTANQAVVEKP